MNGMTLKILTKTYYIAGHPPPCVADVYVERLVEARHTWPNCLYLFLCPALMSPMWRKQLTRACDVLINIPEKYHFWPESMHEPLTFAIVCPLMSRYPFQIKTWDGLSNWKENLLQMWGGDPRVFRTRLCKLWEKNITKPKSM